tara:strand:+ start:125 stop:1024 length:900 start_codon:yes stop_codon:yes gene_type:complete
MKSNIQDIITKKINRNLILKKYNITQKQFYNIKEILSSDVILIKYCENLNEFLYKKEKTIFELIKYAKLICYYLPSFNNLKIFLNKNNKKNKGKIGTFLEYALFGRKPNGDSNCDFSERDLKCIHFKSVWGDYFNAKERLTITNIGNPDNENFGKDIKQSKLNTLKYYKKIRKGLLICLLHDENVKQIIDKKILIILDYDIEKISKNQTRQNNISKQIIEDYNNIQNKIINNNLSQVGQKYLHMCKHGTRNSKNRAFAFNPKFVTQIISEWINNKNNCYYSNIIYKKANSFSIHKRYLL